MIPDQSKKLILMFFEKNDTMWSGKQFLFDWFVWWHKNTLDKCLSPVALMSPNCAKNNCVGCNSFLLHLIQPTVLDSPIQKGWVCQRNKNNKSKKPSNLEKNRHLWDCQVLIVTPTKIHGPLIAGRMSLTFSP